MQDKESFQERHFPDGECFGCGPRNAAGLSIASFATDDGAMVCDSTPRPEHSNGVGAVCGGVLSSILDCHAVTALSQALMERDGALRFAVTKQCTVEFLRATPLEQIRLVAQVTDLRERSGTVVATAAVNGDVCVRFEGVFVVPREAASA